MNEQLISKTVNAILDEYYRPKDDMTLVSGMHLAKKVLEKAEEMKVKAVVAVTNKGGNPVCILCSDDSYIASYDIALNKAYTSVALKMSTKELSKLSTPGAPLYGIQFTNGGKIVIFGGGEPLTNKQGTIIGGLGVSGGSEEEDTSLGKYGKEIFEGGKK